MQSLVIAALALSVYAPLSPPLEALQSDTTSRTQVVMLGTGTPAPNPGRWGPATAVVVDNRAYIFDTGVGVVRQFAAAQRLLDEDVRWSGVAFITHLHSDHTLGYPDLLLSAWTLRWLEEAPSVYGPPGLRAMTDHILAAWSEDISVRTSGEGELSDLAPPRVNVHEIQPGTIYQDSLIEVSAFAVNHGSWEAAYGYRIQTPDKVIVISGDAAPPSTVVDQCDRCDILIHEGGRPATRMGRYYRRFHTTAEEVADIANEARPGLLVLYHQSWDNSLGLAIIRARYSGAVVGARDLDVFR